MKPSHYLTRLFGVAFLSIQSVKAQEQDAREGGTHIYIRGGAVLRELAKRSPKLKIVTSTEVKTGGKDEVGWPCLARTAGGMLFVGEEEKWDVGRRFYLIGETLPPFRSTFSVQLAPLPAMSDERRVALLDWSDVPIWKIVADASRLPPEGQLYLRLEGKTKYGSFKEFVPLEIGEKVVVGRACLLSFAEEISVGLSEFANKEELRPKFTDLREVVTRQEIEEGKFTAGPFLMSASK
jgi:hypothetical protein